MSDEQSTAQQAAPQQRAASQQEALQPKTQAQSESRPAQEPPKAAAQQFSPQPAQPQPAQQLPSQSPDGQAAVQQAVEQALAGERARVSAMLVGAELRAAGLTMEQTQVLLPGLNVSAFITPDGTVDNAKLQSFVGGLRAAPVRIPGSPYQPQSQSDAPAGFQPSNMQSFGRTGAGSIAAYMVARKKAREE